MNPTPALHHLLYVSRSLAEPTEVEALVSAAQQKNARLGVTGALLFTGGCFAQVLEGPQAVLQDLLAAIGQDPRHSGLAVLLQGPITERRFGGWAMKLHEALGADDLVEHLLLAGRCDAERAERLIGRMFD